MNEPVHIDENDNVIINISQITPSSNVFTNCKECGCELFGGEREGEDANGYCDTCN